MPAMPPEYPYDPRSRVVFDGDTANHLVAAAYNLQVVDGAYEPHSREPSLSIRKPPESSYIQITHRLEVDDNVYYKGSVYSHGLNIVGDAEDGSVPPKHTEAIVLALTTSGEWDQALAVGQWVLGTPSRATIAKTDMVSKYGITVSDTNSIRSYPVYLTLANAVPNAIAEVGGKVLDSDNFLTDVRVQLPTGEILEGQTVYCKNYVEDGYTFPKDSYLRVLRADAEDPEGEGSDTLSVWIPLDLWHVQGIAILGGKTASSDELTGIRVDLPNGTYLDDQTVIISGASGFTFPTTYYLPVVYDIGVQKWSGGIGLLPAGTANGQILQWDNTAKAWKLLNPPSTTSVLMSYGSTPYWQEMETFVCPS